MKEKQKRNVKVRLAHLPLEGVGLGVADAVEVLGEARHQGRREKRGLLQQQPEATLNPTTHHAL